MNAAANSVPCRAWRFLATISVMTGVLAMSSCTPWTVRPINDHSDATTSSRHLTPAAYVDSMWSSKLVPQILQSATDARTLSDAMSSSLDDAERKYGRKVGIDAWYFMIKGEGKVLGADTSSRTGLLLVGVQPHSQHADVSIQIGPVLRGSALRDSTGLISFSDFVNQLDFADVAANLNDKAKQTVLASLEPKTLVGKTVQFAGAFEAHTASTPPIADVVPVELALENSK